MAQPQQRYDLSHFAHFKSTQKVAPKLRAVVTGVTGFAGRAMARLLADRGWSVVGSHGTRSAAAQVPAGVHLVQHDLADLDHTMALLREAAPEAVFHLAGRTGADFTTLLASHAAATATLLEAARRLGLDAVFLIPGSSAQFGHIPEHRQPIGEDTDYRPATLYGIAKTTEAWTAAHYQREFGMRIIRTHTFNCIGPGQRADFVPAAFARQIAAMERGAAEPILQVGNLASRRDMTDIRDVASAYYHAATRGRPGAVYNVCTGETHAIGTLVERLRGLSRVDFAIRRDTGRVQSIDIATQRGDAARLQRDTGWRPTVLLDQSLADVLEEWRGVV